MRRFRFRLATLSRLAEARERRERQELARREQSRAASIARLEVAEAEGATGRGRFRALAASNRGETSNAVSIIEKKATVG